MHLVAPLASGISGATNGTAEIYARGTSQRVSYWLDFEATQQVAAADLELDSNGGAEVYVGQLVDVVVKDENGTVVRSFVAGAEAPAVEVRSQSFTGTHYETAARAASNPTTLQAVLDAVKTSFGALDFNVRLDGVSTSVQDALSGFSGVFFNVKAPAYGAVGNGTADDTSAVQAAITACVAAGGGWVVFPAGTYRIVAGLAMNTKVSLLGCGAAVSVLKRDHATNHILDWTTVSASERSVVSGLRFSETQVSSGYQAHVSTNNTDVAFQDCIFDGNSLGTGYLVYQAVGLTGCHVRATRCNFLMAEGQPGFVTESSTTAWSVLEACLFKMTGAAPTVAGASLGAGGNVIGCEFNASAVTSGTFYSLLITGSATQPGTVLGCSFGNPAGGTHKVALDGAPEYGNSFGTSVVLTADDAANTTETRVLGFSQERTYRTATVAATTYTMPENVGTLVITYTAAGDLTVTMPAFRPGRRFRIYFLNQSGSARGVTWSLGTATDSLTPNASVTMNNTAYTQVDFEMFYMNTLACLRYVVTDANRSQPV